MNNDYAPADPKDPVTQTIIGAAFEVANTMGHGFLEAVYRKALLHELDMRGLFAAEEVEYKVHYKGRLVGRYIADLVVADTVVVEIKATDAFNGAHISQTLNYLKASGLKKGLLLNFGRSKLDVRRVVF